MSASQESPITILPSGKTTYELPEEILFDEIKYIETKKENSQKVLDSIKRIFPKNMLQKILNIFMCDKKDFEIQLLEFIIIGFKKTVIVRTSNGVFLGSIIF